MSLYKQVIALPVSGGIDTKVAPQLLEAGMFLDLQNTVRRKTGQLEKRYGFRKRSNLTVDGQVIVSGRRLDTFLEELLLIDDLNLYTYLTSQDRWVEKGMVIPTRVEAEFIASDSGVKAMPDSDILEGLECTAWEDSRGGVYCSLIDLSSGTSILSGVQVTATGTRPRVVGIKTSFVITYIDGSNFKCRRITVGQPDVLTTESTIESGIVDEPYDLTTGEDRNFGIFAYNKASSIRVGALLQTGQVANLATSGVADPVEIALRGRNCVAVVMDSFRQLIYVLFHDSEGTQSEELICVVLAFPTLTTVSPATSLYTYETVRNVTGVPDSTGLIHIFFEDDISAVYYTTAAIFGGAFIPGLVRTLKQNLSLASKAFISRDLPYVTTVYESVLQSTYFTLDLQGKITAKMRQATASGATRDVDGDLKSGLPRVYTIEHKRTVALPVKSRLETITSSVPSSFVGISRQTVDFYDSEFDTARLGRNLTISGGQMQNYDGRSVTEHGFNIYPGDLSAASFSGSGSVQPNKPYRVIAVYEWTDAQGQLHQSAPSVPASVTTGGTANQISVVVMTLQMTDKTSVNITIYRTTADGTTVYYRDKSVPNDPSQLNVIIDLTRSDDSLSQQAILYTVGGTLANIAPPAAIVAHTHKNRLWLGGTEDGNIWYSRQHVEGEGVAFSDGQVIQHGGVTAMGTPASRLVIFREREIHTLSGDGPTDTGIQNDYGVPELLPGDVGCSNQKSLVDTPAGLIFKSLKGFYLLDGALRLRYIGDKVEKFNNLTVTSAVLLKENNEVRFTTREGRCLVYNYYYKEWSTFTNHEAISAIQYKDLFYHLKEDGLVNRETVGAFNDNGARYSMKIETAWFKFAKLQGFQRLYRWALLGEFVSNHYTKVSIAYDYENYYADPTYFDTITGLEQSTYGTGVYGEGDYGGGSSVYQFRSKPEQQKCESFKLLIEDVDTITPAGGGSFKLDTISFELGLKGGLYKMSNAKTRGQQ